MSTVVKRVVRSSPHRNTTQTWEVIVDLLTRGKSGVARDELKSIGGVAASIISDHAPEDAAIVVTCDGPRTRIYCTFDDEAIAGDEAQEDGLGYDALEGDWAVSLPCQKADLVWVQSALKAKSMRITARNMEEAITLEPVKENKSQVLTVNLEGLANL